MGEWNRVPLKLVRASWRADQQKKRPTTWSESWGGRVNSPSPRSAVQPQRKTFPPREEWHVRAKGWAQTGQSRPYRVLGWLEYKKRPSISKGENFIHRLRRFVLRTPRDFGASSSDRGCVRQHNSSSRFRISSPRVSRALQCLQSGLWILSKDNRQQIQRLNVVPSPLPFKDLPGLFLLAADFTTTAFMANSFLTARTAAIILQPLRPSHLS